MVAFPDDFRRIHFATADDELAEEVLEEYRGILEKQTRTVELRDGSTAYLFLDLREDDITRVLSRYDGEAKYALFKLDLDGNYVDPNRISNMAEFISDCLTE